MSFALRVDDDAPRYFRHRTLGGACETSFECTGVTLLSAREGDGGSTRGGADGEVANVG